MHQILVKHCLEMWLSGLPAAYTENCRDWMFNREEGRNV